MDFNSWASLPAAFYDQAARLADRNFLWTKVGGTYRPTTWREAERATTDLARGLRDLGLKPGQKVVLLSENRPEWLIADVAIMTAGGVSVPAYTTSTTSDHRHILTDSGAVGAIVSSKALAGRLLPAAVEAPDCQWVIAMENVDSNGSGGNGSESIALHLWADVLAKGAASSLDAASMLTPIKRRDTACFIYTSGTGGAPKGVMLSHGAILCNCMGAHHLLEQLGLRDEVFLSFLPLSHAYEHTAGQFFPVSIGAEIYYCAGVEHLLTNLAEAKPTIMTAVPRLYENMYQRILLGVEKQGGLKQKLFNLALRLGQMKYRNPGSLSLLERVQDTLVDKLVRDKMRARFGGRLKAMVSGGAALNPEIGIFFTALGLPVLQGYGQTESAPVISANPPNRVKMETVGPPLKGVEVKIAEDGEILVRGELVMQGYWRKEGATAKALRDGWLHTGDIGEIDDDGYLKITDRKKDILVLTGGDNVSPARIEGFLTLQPEIHQAMVFGDKRPHLVSLIVPEEAFVTEFAKSAGVAAKLSELSENGDFRTAISKVVDRVNLGLSNLEKVRRFAIAAEPFTVENEMMTPTLKIRRHRIIEAYGQILRDLY